MKDQSHVVMLRQPDRRLYPCIVLRDARGLVAVYAAPLGRRASRVTAADVEVLKTFRGVEQMRIRRVPDGIQVWGQWAPERDNQFSYMMTRPDVQPRGVNWALRFEMTQAKINAQLREQARLQVFDSHALSGLR